MGSKQRKGSLNVTIVENLAIYLNTAAQKLGMKVKKVMPHKYQAPDQIPPVLQSVSLELHKLKIRKTRYGRACGQKFDLKTH